MATALTVEQFLGAHHLAFELVAHRRTSTSLQTAKAAGITPRLLAKAVILQENGRYLMAVLPTTRHLRLGELRRQSGRDFGMATEGEVRQIFPDCAPGAIPAVGLAYGLDMIWDESLMNAPDLYIEAGDHEHLVHLATPDYLGILGACPHGNFSEPV